MFYSLPTHLPHPSIYIKLKMSHNTPTTTSPFLCGCSLFCHSSLPLHWSITAICTGRGVQLSLMWKPSFCLEFSVQLQFWHRMQFFARLDPTNLIFLSVMFPNQNSKYKISCAFPDSKKVRKLCKTYIKNNAITWFYGVFLSPCSNILYAIMCLKNWWRFHRIFKTQDFY